ncbi:MAG: transcriptional repressor [Desulfovibrionaceae bacterium]|nr:transcriptional repressor [Desulfovibrionaceae bacterium]
MSNSCEQKENNGIQRRLTKQRKIILEELANMTCHPTADELYQVVRRRMPNISLGTVYRNLDFLAEQGQIAKIEYSGNQMRFDAYLDFHQHVRCIKCGAVGDVFAGVKPPRVCNMDVPGFTVTGARVEYDGICDKCALQSTHN